MSVLALKLLLAPGFVVGASLAVRRFGPHVGGLVGGLPVVAGPILLVIAVVHGRGFGADTAAASLLGLVSLTAFVVAYFQVCPRVGLWVALPIGWLTFLAATAIQSAIHVSAAAGLALVAAALVLSLRLLSAPEGPAEATGAPPSWDLPARALCAAAMVVALTGAADGLGPHLSGLLAPFPIITSVLAGFTHHQRGAADTQRLLRGMLVAFFAFGLFCFVVAVTLRPAGAVVAFGAATAVAVLTQTIVLRASVVGGRAAVAATAEAGGRAG